MADQPTILFVDDEATVTDVLARTFERRYRVLTASSGPRALELLRTGRVDVLVTDQKMPEMTGTQLAAAARAEGLEPVVILLTAYTDPPDIIAAINQGQVYRYVTKPWDLADLMLTVKNAVDLVAMKQEQARLHASLRKRVEALSVLYEVSRGGAGQGGAESILDRLLEVLGRVLPHDCGAALVDPGDGRTASLRIRGRGPVGEKGLLAVKEAVLAHHRKAAGALLPEERVVTHVLGGRAAPGEGLSAFPASISAPLVSRGQVVGTLSLFSSDPAAYGQDDVELLDLLVNQTTEAITTLRAAEGDARRRIEQMVEAMADGVVLLDERQEVVVANPAARALLGLGDDAANQTLPRVEEALGFSPFQVVRGWEYSGQKVFREELTLRDRRLRLTVSPVAEPSGRNRGVVLVLNDVTDQQALEQRKDDFVSMVSHELRTPLTSITGALDLVLNYITGDVNPKQRRFLEMARDSVEKLNSIVDDLLDLSKFARGRMRMSFELTSLDDLVSKAVEKYGPAMLEKKLAVSAELPGAPLRVLADPNRVTQVLNNLLTNAQKFTPEGGQVKVEVKSDVAMPGYAVLSVWNSGPAIAPDDLERIFDRFEQARTATTRTLRGTGLGLSICRSIVHAHGGRVWAEREAQGARFVVVLPVEPAADVLDPPLHAPPPDENRPPRATVLVVEDVPELAWIQKAALLHRGFRVLVARDGEEALALARAHRPQVIALDYKLPDIDGLKLLEIFRHDADTRSAKVVMVSGFDERERATRAGAHAWLQKPVGAEAFVAAVEGLAAGAVPGRGRVLVVDDDPKICAVCAEVLGNLGFAVDQAASLAEARARLRAHRPDVVLLDVVLPDGDGFGFFEELKAHRASSPLSVLFISARTETSAKVRALKLGGDDYISKPFDALELGARVESVVRRRAADTTPSPTTQLPGSGAIEREVQRRLQARERFAFCYLDLDNFKAYNDYYGFAKADGVVKQTGDLLREVFAQHGASGDFLGHVAGDDFVFVTGMDTADAVCRHAVEAFDRIIPLYYDKADRERGYIEADDRFGQRRQFPIMSVSVVAVLGDAGSTHAGLARAAADLKQKAKAVPGSVYLRADAPAAAESA